MLHAYDNKINSFSFEPNLMAHTFNHPKKDTHNQANYTKERKERRKLSPFIKLLSSACTNYYLLSDFYIHSTLIWEEVKTL